MFEFDDILKEEIDLIIIDLIKKYDELGMRSSGKWANSLEPIIKEGSAVLLGEDYTQQLSTGRRPGTFPPIKAIEQWIIEKPISLEAGMKLSTLAFLIARKIAENGTVYFQEGGTDLLDAVITPQRIQSIINKVSEFQIKELETDLVGRFKEILV